MAKKEKTCPKCKGNKTIKYGAGPGPFGEQTWYEDACRACGGTGKVARRTREEERDARESLNTIRGEYGLSRLP